MVEKAKEPFSLHGPNGGNNQYNQCRVIPHEDDEVKGDIETDWSLMLKYHHQFGHVSFQQLKELVKQGVIPKRLMKVIPPMCAVCAYAKATRKPLKNKERIDYEAIKYTRPGEMVSVN